VRESNVKHADVKQPIGPLLPGTKQVLLTFSEGRTISRDGRVDQHTAFVQRSFLPKGLILWGSTDSTFVHRIGVGNMVEVEIGGDQAIPGRYFEQGRSFEELERLAEVGELELSLPARQVLEMTEASPGMSIAVHLSGPYDRFVVWGLTYSGLDRAHRRATIEPLESGRFMGRLDEVTLSGVRTVLDVTAPDAQTAATLLAALQNSGARY